jgi:hypothetical protein
MRATRATVSLPFGSSVEMLGLASGTSLHRFSFMSGDGKRLYYWNAQGGKYVVSRPDISSRSGRRRRPRS